MPDIFISEFTASFVIRVVGLLVSLALVFRTWHSFWQSPSHDRVWDFLAALTGVGLFAALTLAAIGGHIAFDGARGTSNDLMAWFASLYDQGHALRVIGWLNAALSAFAVGGAITLLISWHPAKVEGNGKEDSET